MSPRLSSVSEARPPLMRPKLQRPNPPRPRPIRLTAIVLAVAMVGFLALLATRQPAATRIAQSPLLGKRAPEISGVSLDGRAVRLSGLAGRYVLINFFATWCVPCQREHPELREFVDANPSRATVVSVIFDDEPDRVRQFFAERGGDWPVMADPSGKVSLDYGVRGPPESFLIDPDGFVVSRVVGEVTAEGLQGLLSEADRR